MRYSAVFAALVVAAAAAPVLSLPIGLWAREADNDALYERSIEEDTFWPRDIMPRDPPRPLPKPPPRPLPKPPPRPLPKPPHRRSAYDEAMEVLAREYEEDLVARWMELDELD